jgi:uncharacterized membrane protein
MLTTIDQDPQPNQRPTITAPVFPGTPSEFITVMVHYHRAEIARMAGWSDQIDRTANWAITVMAAMLYIPERHRGGDPLPLDTHCRSVFTGSSRL